MGVVLSRGLGQSLKRKLFYAGWSKSKFTVINVIISNNTRINCVLRTVNLLLP